jgi:hypothetical protein
MLPKRTHMNPDSQVFYQSMPSCLLRIFQRYQSPFDIDEISDILGTFAVN